MDLPLWIYLFVSVIKQNNFRSNILIKTLKMLNKACEITIDYYFLKGEFCNLLRFYFSKGLYRIYQ